MCARMDDDGTYVRMTVAQAAQALGISAEAVRQRVRRGKLPTEKSEDGTVFVLVDAERTRTDTQGTGGGTTDKVFIEAYLAHALSEIRFLREELATRNEELRRKDHIIAAFAERIPELEAPPEARESAEPRSEGSTPTEQKGAAQETTSRPWWRRVFGA